jgi:hypothetical protein
VTGPTKHFHHIRPQACRDHGCSVSRHDRDGEVHLQHNEDPCLKIGAGELVDVDRDLWGDLVIPWLRGFHNAD